eukprot:1684061-Alexandrium_andersonii.AAC.1
MQVPLLLGCVSAEVVHRRAAVQPARYVPGNGAPLPGTLGRDHPQDRSAERGRVDCGVVSKVHTVRIAALQHRVIMEPRDPRPTEWAYGLGDPQRRKAPTRERAPRSCTRAQSHSPPPAYSAGAPRKGPATKSQRPGARAGSGRPFPAGVGRASP